MGNYSQMLKTREPTLLDRDDGHWYQTKFDDVYPSISTILSATASDEKKNGLKNCQNLTIFLEIKKYAKEQIAEQLENW